MCSGCRLFDIFTSGESSLVLFHLSDAILVLFSVVPVALLRVIVVLALRIAETVVELIIVAVIRIGDRSIRACFAVTATDVASMSTSP